LDANFSAHFLVTLLFYWAHPSPHEPEHPVPASTSLWRGARFSALPAWHETC